MAQQIFELGKKVAVLREWAARNRQDQLSSERALAEESGINRSTLKSSIDSERMSKENQQRLAKVYRFNIDWPEWHDRNADRQMPGYQRRDTSVAFKDKFWKHKARGACLTIEAGSMEKSIDRRFADFTLAVPKSFDPSAEHDGIPLVLSLSFDERGWPIYLPGSNEVFAIGLRQADLQLFKENANAKIHAFNIECQSDAEGNFRARVEGLAPWWIIGVGKSDGDWLAGRRLAQDGKDCICERFSSGDNIRALMTARINDCFVKLPDEFGQGSKTKTLLIEHLIKRFAFQDFDRPEAVLGEQILTVVDKS